MNFLVSFFAVNRTLSRIFLRFFYCAGSNKVIVMEIVKNDQRGVVGCQTLVFANEQMQQDDKTQGIGTMVREHILRGVAIHGRGERDYFDLKVITAAPAHTQV